jgi:hypothetical protein
MAGTASSVILLSAVRPRQPARRGPGSAGRDKAGPAGRANGSTAGRDGASSAGRAKGSTAGRDGASSAGPDGAVRAGSGLRREAEHV